MELHTEKTQVQHYVDEAMRCLRKIAADTYCLKTHGRAFIIYDSSLDSMAVRVTASRPGAARFKAHVKANNDQIVVEYDNDDMRALRDDPQAVVDYSKALFEICWKLVHGEGSDPGEPRGDH